MNYWKKATAVVGYAYNGALLCRECGEATIAAATARGATDTGCSISYPQTVLRLHLEGAEHCGECGEPLDD